MVLARESFLDLTIVELLQNINCYHDSLRDYKKLVRPVQDFLYRYLQWCEEICSRKWNNSVLPSFWFVRQRIIMRDPLFEPPATLYAEKYFDFSRSQKHILRHKTNDWNIL